MFKKGCNVYLLLLLVIVFFIGFSFYPLLYQTEKQIPSSYYKSAPELLSPSDHIKENQIHVYKNKIIIDLVDGEWAGFTDTNSMDPLIDSNTNAIQIVPKSTSEIKPGDIISYKTSEGIVIHRVVATGKDEDGWYAITKGDNNPVNDPEKVRFEDVQRLLVGIIY